VWDLLSSEEAVGLVATHLAHPLHEPISRETVKSGLIPEMEESKQMHPGPRPKGEERPGFWLYEDRNAATHLIRNAFNSSSAVETVRDMLSLKPPIARSFKDDVTCSCVRRVKSVTLLKTFHL
jgi:pyruvate dehydrogenase phosphatase